MAKYTKAELDGAYDACHAAYVAARDAQAGTDREAESAAWNEYYRLNDAWHAMERENSTLTLEIDSMGMDAGNAFLSVTPDSAVRDVRLAGRFGRTDRGVYLETYSAAELGATGETFGSVYVEASSRKAAIVKLLRQLGYPRGTAFEITYAKD